MQEGAALHAGRQAHLDTIESRSFPNAWPFRSFALNPCHLPYVYQGLGHGRRSVTFVGIHEDCVLRRKHVDSKLKTSLTRHVAAVPPRYC
ncbi:hypothetical protein AVEN_236213-1 [Araneus ventricosus]|uniref:Uncharacterized protein n=1 Tax=Araneus ventricosus TaxID=182803 RepID=A0A4Y2CAP4_ARAVE|nr:hypothetical protein AVEN_236213-1 [Araneus ventricosus]